MALARRKLEPGIVDPALGRFYIGLWLACQFFAGVVAEEVVEPEPELPGEVGAGERQHGPVAQFIDDRARVRFSQEGGDGPFGDITRA